MKHARTVKLHQNIKDYNGSYLCFEHQYFYHAPST